MMSFQTNMIVFFFKNAKGDAQYIVQAALLLTIKVNGDCVFQGQNQKQNCKSSPCGLSFAL